MRRHHPQGQQPKVAIKTITIDLLTLLRYLISVACFTGIRYISFSISAYWSYAYTFDAKAEAQNLATLNPGPTRSLTSHSARWRRTGQSCSVAPQVGGRIESPLKKTSSPVIKSFSSTSGFPLHFKYKHLRT